MPPPLGIIAYVVLCESHVCLYRRHSAVEEDVRLRQIRMLAGVLRIFHLGTRPSQHIGAGATQQRAGRAWPGGGVVEDIVLLLACHA